MSSPFFIEPCLYRQGSFFLMDRRVRPKGLGSSLSFKNPVSNETGFFVLEKSAILPLKYTTTCIAPIGASYRVARIAGQLVFRT